MGALLVVSSAFISSYSYYKLRNVYSLIERNKVVELPVSQSVSQILATFDSFRIEFNRMLSVPSSYSSEDIKNSVLKYNVEKQIEGVFSVLQSYETLLDADTLEFYMYKMDDANKAFKNYVIAGTAVISAFSSKDYQDTKQKENIQSFNDIMKSNETFFVTALTELDSKIAVNTLLGGNAIRAYFTNASFWIWLLLLLMITSFVALFIYVNRVSRFIRVINNALEDIRDGHLQADELSSSIPFAPEQEFFELADKVTHIAGIMNNDITANKDKIKNLDDDVLRLRAVSSYTSAVLNSIEFSIMVTDGLLRVTFVNSEFERAWRMKRSSVVDTGIEDLAFMRLIPEWKKAMLDIASGKNSEKEKFIQVEYKMSAEKSKKLDIYIMPLKDTAGKGIIGTISLSREAGV